MASADLKQIFFVDLERELAVTRRVLEALPEEHYGWKPHEKSMSLMQLGIHVATMPEWIDGTLRTDHLDIAAAPRPPKSATRAELLALFEKNVATLRQTVANFDIGTVTNMWTIANGPTPFASKPRDFVYRVWCINHLIHHRGQLAVYLRMLNVPVPTIYFNTSDNPAMTFE